MPTAPSERFHNSGASGFLHVKDDREIVRGIDAINEAIVRTFCAPNFTLQ